MLAKILISFIKSAYEIHLRSVMFEIISLTVESVYNGVKRIKFNPFQRKHPVVRTAFTARGDKHLNNEYTFVAPTFLC